MNTFSTRRAVAGDAAALRALNREFNGDSTSLRWIQRRLTEAEAAERVFVSVEANKVIGFCCVTVVKSCCREKPRAEVTELFVAKTHRRNGVATGLMLAAAQHADSADVGEFFVLTNKMNGAGRRFYESLGYVEGNDTLYRRKA
jgi:GNAT superfamily N-acetyltransferase